MRAHHVAQIADGCRRPCAFCAIPKIKGTAVSRPLESIVREAVQLQAMGVKEIILIAQDSTDWGYDLGYKDGMAVLLDAICAAAPGIRWIRIMYAYPGYVTPKMIDRPDATRNSDAALARPVRNWTT